MTQLGRERASIIGQLDGAGAGQGRLSGAHISRWNNIFTSHKQGLQKTLWRRWGLQLHNIMTERLKGDDQLRLASTLFGDTPPHTSFAGHASKFNHWHGPDMLRRSIEVRSKLFALGAMMY
jgi:hypothetical protein